MGREVSGAPAPPRSGVRSSEPFGNAFAPLNKRLSQRIFCIKLRLIPYPEPGIGTRYKPRTRSIFGVLQTTCNGLFSTAVPCSHYSMPTFRVQAKISSLYVPIYGLYVLIKRPGLRLVFSL